MCDEDVAAIVIDNGSGKIFRKEKEIYSNDFFCTKINRYVQSWLCR